MDNQLAEESRPLREVSLLALKLGATAFGGPAAHIAMLRDEVVNRRRWMDDAHFLDLLAATNLIPGPNSTEMVIHTGFHRAGWRGLAFAWIYERYGTTPQLESVLYGVKPVVIAVILSMIGFNELAILIGFGLLVMTARLAGDRIGLSGLLVPPGLLDLSQRCSDLVPIIATAIEPYSPLRLFLEFLKIGGTLYGTGYVLLSFMQQDFVEKLGWITEQQLLDAVAIGQFTPGPVFTTATFVGYLIGGWKGAALATIAIFLPAFIFVAATNPLLP